MRFLVDGMLGRLARWLRLFGYDTEYFNQKNKKDLIYKGLKENRIILTRDSHISKKKAINLVLIKSTDLKEQLKQVVAELKIDTETNKFRRCIECNEILSEIEKEKVKELVPPFIYETVKEFSLCKKCNKIYWPGTHLELAKKVIAEINN